MDFSSIYESRQRGASIGGFGFGGFSIEDLPSNFVGAMWAIGKVQSAQEIEDICQVLSAADSRDVFDYGIGPTLNLSYIPIKWEWSLRGYLETGRCPCGREGRTVPRSGRRVVEQPQNEEQMLKANELFSYQFDQGIYWSHAP